MQVCYIHLYILHRKLFIQTQIANVCVPTLLLPDWLAHLYNQDDGRSIFYKAFHSSSKTGLRYRYLRYKTVLESFSNNILSKRYVILLSTLSPDWFNFHKPSWWREMLFYYFSLNFLWRLFYGIRDFSVYSYFCNSYGYVYP
jgi:hypothetical protein